MNGPNQLATWMQFYRDNLRPGGGGMDYGRWNSAPPDNGATWALGMLDRFGSGDAPAKPNFFADEPAPAAPAYVRPERTSTPMPQRRPMQDPMRGRIQNYLLNFLER